jgi:mono/diheme cytochrome c family protein
MLSHPMRRRLPLTLAAAAAAVLLVACGEQKIDVAKEDVPTAHIFINHCAGCHTLQQAGTEGSATNVRTREYKDGPNFNQRHETKNCVLYAIRNGGFSSGPMPQNIVTGQEAQQVAAFVAKYSKPKTPSGGPPVKIPDCPAG